MYNENTFYTLLFITLMTWLVCFKVPEPWQLAPEFPKVQRVKPRSYGLVTEQLFSGEE
jgi:hypothetical protein